MSFRWFSKGSISDLRYCNSYERSQVSRSTLTLRTGDKVLVKNAQTTPLFFAGAWVTIHDINRFDSSICLCDVGTVNSQPKILRVYSSAILKNLDVKPSTEELNCIHESMAKIGNSFLTTGFLEKIPTLSEIVSTVTQ
jgi:hypothetical protein